MNVCDAGQWVEPAAKPFYRTRRVYVSKDGPRRTIRGKILSPIEFLGLDQGRHAFIVPNKLGSANYAKSARSIVAGDNNLYLVQDYASIPVFPVAVYPIVYGVQKGERDVNTTVLYERMALNATSLA